MKPKAIKRAAAGLVVVFGANNIAALHLVGAAGAASRAPRGLPAALGMPSLKSPGGLTAPGVPPPAREALGASGVAGESGAQEAKRGPAHPGSGALATARSCVVGLGHRLASFGRSVRDAALGLARSAGSRLAGLDLLKPDIEGNPFFRLQKEAILLSRRVDETIDLDVPLPPELRNLKPFDPRSPRALPQSGPSPAPQPEASVRTPSRARTSHPATAVGDWGGSADRMLLAAPPAEADPPAAEAQAAKPPNKESPEAPAPTMQPARPDDGPQRPVNDKSRVVKFKSMVDIWKITDFSAAKRGRAAGAQNQAASAGGAQGAARAPMAQNPDGNFWGMQTGQQGINAIKALARTQAQAHARPGRMSRMDGQWNEGKGIRFRINYLNPVAFSRADGRGMHYNEPGRLMHNPGEVLPPQYWGTYALYLHGQTVEYEIEIENTGRRTLRNVHILAVQEVFNQSGGAGKALQDQAREITLDSLPAGQARKARNSFTVTSDWSLHGSLEQTHVRIRARNGPDSTPETLAEAYQAGLIDPPPD